MGMKKLFVYGTLRDFHQNSARLGLAGQCEVIKDVKLPGFDLFDLGWFPGLVPGTGTVLGDVFDVPDSLYPALDQYEGVPHLYRRETIIIEPLGDVQVYVYNNTPDPTRRVVNGDWQHHVNQTQSA